ncbi:MAG TPA: ABC transporter permease [Burkholderiales bacterium]|nr:ABC transporter permease [Burkholderiales bacterium]
MTAPAATDEAAPAIRAPEVRRTGAGSVALAGAWTLRSLQPRLRELEQALSRVDGGRWDLTGIDTLDHTGALLLWRAWGRRLPDAAEVRPEHSALFERLEAREPRPIRRGRRRFIGPIEALGRAMIGFSRNLAGMTVLLGRVALEVLGLVHHPTRTPWREISANIYRTGAQALGITALVGFLVGVVLSYLSAQQLRNFGADVYIVNLLGVAIVRELGPVLAAILVAGRSGSAMTAQIGVMRVTEELDALAVMGIPHTLRLVLPKTIALAVAMPLLILWTNAIALIGGMVCAQFQLGIDWRYFLANLPAAVPISNLYLGLAKGVVFGIFIALTACHFGLRVKPNTESLGEGTTNSVVTAITLVIVIDAVFAVLFRNVGSFLS